MINNIIELGKQLNIDPFTEEVKDGQKIVQFVLGCKNKEFYLKNTDGPKDVKEDEKNKIFYFGIRDFSKGRNNYFLKDLKDFSNKWVTGKEKNKEKFVAKIKLGFQITINNNKKERDYKKLLNLNLITGIQYEFISNFYKLAVSDEFIGKVFDYLSKYSKKELSDLVYVFSFLSADLKKYYNFEYKSEIVYLGEIEFIRKAICDLDPICNLNEIKGGICNFCCQKKDIVFSPRSGTFYWLFVSGEKKKNNTYNLSGENSLHQNIICTDCYTNLKKGKLFSKKYLSSTLHGVKFISSLHLYLPISKVKNVYKELIRNLKERDIEKIYNKDEIKKYKIKESVIDQLIWELAGSPNSGATIDFWFYYDNILFYKFFLDIPV